MMLGVKEMDTSNENKITIIAVIVAIIVGVVLQIVFKLPLIVSLVGSVSVSYTHLTLPTSDLG